MAVIRYAPRSLFSYNSGHQNKENMMKKWLALCLLAVMPTLAAAAPAPQPAATLPLVEGRDYSLIANPTPAPAGTVEVREFFWYGCPHCFRLDPFVSAWLQGKPAGVSFIRTPVALSKDWEANTRGFYVAETLNKVDATHKALFDAIHLRHERLFDQQSLAAFYARYGISQSNFNGLYQSFAVNGKVAQARNLAIRYQITGVPAIIVNGKYLVQGETQRTIDVVKALVAREQQAKR